MIAWRGMSPGSELWETNKSTASTFFYIDFDFMNADSVAATK